MPKGDIAKSSVINKLLNFFGSNYCGAEKNKLYIFEDDGSNGRIQLCLTITAPKTEFIAPEGQSAVDHSDWNWDDPAPAAQAPTPTPKAEVTPEEQARIADMMARLGL